jgi:hypothetical protein
MSYCGATLDALLGRKRSLAIREFALSIGPLHVASALEFGVYAGSTFLLSRSSAATDVAVIAWSHMASHDQGRPRVTPAQSS